MAELITINSLITDANLKAYYRFELATLADDYTANNHDLTAISVPVADSNGKYGGAVAFDGNDAYSATDGADFKPTTAFTVSAWVKTSAAAYQEIFQSFSLNTNSAGFYIEVRDDGKLGAVSGKNTGTTPNTDYKIIVSDSTVNDGNWHHIAYTWNGTHLNLYVDGVVDATTAAWANAPAFAATNYIRVGCKNCDGSNDIFFIGSLDDVAFIKDEALTAGQILQLYNPTPATTNYLKYHNPRRQSHF
jgi:hypothetical protein